VLREALHGGGTRGEEISVRLRPAEEGTSVDGYYAAPLGSAEYPRWSALRLPTSRGAVGDAARSYGIQSRRCETPA
jgi:hypothetical protein